MEEANPPRKSLKTSRLGLLKRVGAVGVTAAAAGTLTRSTPAETVVVKTVGREGAVSLTADEIETIEAIVARLIPTDANGPGAKEARVARYIDWALGGGLGFFRADYESGLARTNAYAISLHGASFSKLTAAQQDAILTNMQRNTAPGFTPNSQTFFNLIRGHTVEGMFGDPFHGGNENLVGWDLIGYPGVKLNEVTRQDQSLDYTPKPTRKTAYDFELFKKLKSRDPARKSDPAPSNSTKSGGHHGH
jgi:gluconate 2-dehydrogenase gamma chain